MVAEQTPEERRKPKGRSPSYPGIGLGEAVEKAAVLYQKEGRHAAPTDVITTHWGYKPKTGPGLVAVAALKKFGLLEDEGGNGSRRARLTPLALSIVLDEPDSPERQQLVREAALTPPIHAELWSDFGGRLPSDQNLRRTLVLERGFTDSGAHQFIRQFKNTILFAALDEPDKMPGAQLPQHRPSEERMAPQTGRPPGISSEEVLGFRRRSPEAGGRTEVRTLLLPVGEEPWPVLQVPVPMTEEAWAQMLDAINVFKVGVVRKAASVEDPPSDQPPSATPEDTTDMNPGR
jgi:hypothetical protein